MIAELNGIRMHFERKGEGAPVVFLHGNGESCALFAECVDRLSEHFTVYAPDSRCHGGSSAGKLGYREMAEDTEAFLRQVVCPAHSERPVLFGFSDGGIVGLLVASHAPELLSRLIAAGVNVRPGGLKFFFRLIIWLQNLFHPDEKLKLMLKEPHIPAQELAQIQIPVLLTAGQNDVVRTRHTRRLAGHIPGCRLKILPGESHSSYVEDPDKLLALLEDELLH